MTRNTKEVALIQIRSGKLSEMPKALHQSEFGLAKDANRVFLGNASNTILKNRSIFPYQNLELLTEFSELKDYFKYSYENNITSAKDENNNIIVDRLKLKEFLPIVVSCQSDAPPQTTSEINGILKINNIDVTLEAGLDMYGIISKINAVSKDTSTYATCFPGTRVISFICTSNELEVSDNVSGALLQMIGYPENPTYDISMPIRKVTEKLDDNLNITDFGVKGDGISISSKKIFEALVETYKNFPDKQFYRSVFFPAGTYVYDTTNDDENTPYFTPFPLISNLHVRGEGIDRTIISNATTNTLISCIDDNFNAMYAYPNDYATKIDNNPSNILIEDMTFNSNSQILMELVGCYNVTFNRVRFSGSGTNTLASIYGKERIIDGAQNDLYAKNVTFNECIFENSACGANITEYAENVTFNNCKFVGIKSPALLIGNDDTTKENVRAITINGCMFENTVITETNKSVITLGINSKYVTTTNCSFDDNIIDRSNTSNIIPYLDKGVGDEYSNIVSYSVGDRCIHEHKYYKALSNIVNENFNPSKWEEYQRYNYSDVLNINTDDKKLLRFKFSQPLWEYINYLTNLNGAVVLTVDGKDSDITAANGLNITENNNGIEIKSVKSGDVTISLDKEATLELGKPTGDYEWKSSTHYYVNNKVIHNGIIYSCNTEHTSSLTFEEDENKWNVVSLSQIVIDRVLQLNGNMISNRDGDNNIIIEPSTDKIIEIKQTEESQTNYEYKIVDNNNAVPNVAFVKNYSRGSLIKHVTKSDLANLNENGYLLIDEFTKEKYGNNVHITGVTVNVRNPFYKVVPYLNTSSVEYKSGFMYYQGDVVRDTNNYAVIKKTHRSESNTISNNDLMEIIPLNTYTYDIKYVNVIGLDEDGEEHNLTETFNNDFSLYCSNYTIDRPNIQKNNLFGYTSAPEFNLLTPEGTSERIVSYQDRNYYIHDGKIPPGVSGLLLLHSYGYEYPPEDEDDPGIGTAFERCYDEGYIYKFDEDINFNMGDASVENPYSINYAGGNIMLAFYLDDNNPLIYKNEEDVTVNRKNESLLNPGGDLIVKVDFVKEEV